MSREKEFLEYVLSSVLAMVGQSIYILADTYFVARGLGANGLAALNLAIPIYNFINGVGLMLGIGGAARFIVARTVGDKKRSRQIYTTGSGLRSACGLWLCAARHLFRESDCDAARCQSGDV